MSKDSDDRASHAIAYQWASRIMTVSLGMVLPGVLGHLIDRWLGSRVVFTLIGFSLGLILGIVQLLRMTSADSGNGSRPASGKQERTER